MELEYAKRFEQRDHQDEGGAPKAGDEEEPSPLPPKADVSWAHILAQNQVGRGRGMGWTKNIVLIKSIALVPLRPL